MSAPTVRYRDYNPNEPPQFNEWVRVLDVVPASAAAPPGPANGRSPVVIAGHRRSGLWAPLALVVLGVSGLGWFAKSRFPKPAANPKPPASSKPVTAPPGNAPGFTPTPPATDPAASQDWRIESVTIEGDGTHIKVKLNKNAGDRIIDITIKDVHSAQTYTASVPAHSDTGIYSLKHPVKKIWVTATIEPAKMPTSNQARTPAAKEEKPPVWCLEAQPDKPSDAAPSASPRATLPSGAPVTPGAPAPAAGQGAPVTPASGAPAPGAEKKGADQTGNKAKTPTGEAGAINADPKKSANPNAGG